MASRQNALDQELDIAGSYNQSATLVLADEPNLLGAALTGQTGAGATISAASGGISTLTGLTGMVTQSVGRFISVSGAANGGNNGAFLIVAYNSATSVDIANASGVFPDANSGSLSWSERRPYSLEDDLNYERTDRQAIKGVAYFNPVPTYIRPTATNVNVPANLSNIASKTTDAKSIITDRKFENVTVALSNSFVTLTDAGNLKHADAIDLTGIPIWDGYDINNWSATYCEIASQLEQELTVNGGPYDGYRIFGRARAGSGVSPNSFEVEFRCVERGADISTSVPYSWDGYQPTSIDIYYPYRERFDLMPEHALRRTLVNGLISDSGGSISLNNILTLLGVSQNDTSLSTYLTNTGQYFPFYNLPDATPSVVEALNTLNEQIGNRDYTGNILTDGYTVTQSLQQLANAIENASSFRTIERLAADIPANTVHTLPGGLTYTLDNTNNGRTMWVFVRGVLKDPGPISAGNDYQEVSTTQIRFYQRVKNTDHINYVIYS